MFFLLSLFPLYDYVTYTLINHLFVTNILIDMFLEINKIRILWLPIMLTNNNQSPSSEYVKQFKFSYNCSHTELTFVCIFQLLP